MNTRTTLILAACLALPGTLQAQMNKSADHYHTIFATYDHINMENFRDKTATKENYPYNGFSIGYEYSLKLAKNVPMYLSVGAAVNMNFYHQTKDSYQEIDERTVNILDSETGKKYIYPAKITSLIENDHTTMYYGGIRAPFNFSYEFYSRNGDWTFAPYMGGHIQVNLKAKLKNSYDQTILDIQWTEKSPTDELDIEIDGLNKKEHYDEERQLLSEEYYGGLSVKRIFFGWQAGVNVRYKQHYGIGFGYENEFGRISGRFSTETLRVRISYTF